MGFLSHALTAGGNAMGAYQNASAQKKQRDIATALQAQQLAREEKQDLLRASLMGAQTDYSRAQTAKLSAPPLPKRTYSDTRGAMVDEDTSTATPVAGLPPLPEKPDAAPRLGSDEWKKAKAWEFANQPRPEPTNVFQTGVDSEGKPTIFAGKSKGDPNLQDTGVNKPTATGLRGLGSVGLHKAIASNSSQIAVLDDALKELEAHPDAIGLKRGLGEVVPMAGRVADKLNQSVDPKGVAARAQMSNIGSLKIHDRSGAAVTVGEFPRLAPFIPSVIDSPEAARIKLGKLREQILIETGFLREAVGTQQGSPATPQRRSTDNPTKTLQQLWDEAVKIHGEAKTIAEIGPRPDDN